MDSIWATLGSFPPAPAKAASTEKLDAAIKVYVASVDRLVNQQGAALAANAKHLLAKIDASTNSIGFLALLNLCFDPKTPSPAISRDSLLNHTVLFLVSFQPRQVRYVGFAFRTLLEHVASGKTFPPYAAVEVITSALLRLEPSGSMFTSMHLPLVRLAYETGCEDPVLRLIDHDITLYPGMPGQKNSKPLCADDLSPTSYISLDTGLTEPVNYTMVLEYDIVCGLIYMSKRNWAKAYKVLERAVAYPTRDKVASKIMIEAYKKWLLVGLLKDGEEPTLPSYTVPVAKTTYNALSSPYKTVAGLFNTENAGQLSMEVQANLQVWEEDGNLSLLNEVVSAYQKWQIIRLRSIYQQVPISLIRTTTRSAQTGEQLPSDQEVVNLVRGMLDSGMLHGELQIGNEGAESYVLYHDETAMAELEFAQEVSRCQKSIESLGRQYRAAHERLGSSKDYVRHLIREQRRVEKEAGDPGLGFDNQIEDEDLMTDVMALG